MSATAADVLALARAEIGTGEFPPGSNKQEYAKTAGHANGYAWCATFVSAMMIRAGVPVPKGILVASSRTMFANAKAAKLSIPMKNVGPGDVVHMTRGPLQGWLGHVAIVEEVLANGMIVTIEGNTNGSGSATGGSVLRHTRQPSAWNLGAWRPPYIATVPPKTLWILPDMPGQLRGAIVLPTAMDKGTWLPGPEVVARHSAGWAEVVRRGRITVVDLGGRVVG